MFTLVVVRLIVISPKLDTHTLLESPSEAAFAVPLLCTKVHHGWRRLDPQAHAILRLPRVEAPR